MTTPDLISFPARPVNGGRLEHAPLKVGPWVYQPKIDDWRAIVHTPTQRIWNRHGQPMSIEAELATALMILSGSPFEWLDVGVMERRNQLLRGTIVVFDWIPVVSAVPGPLQNLLSHSERRRHLENEFEELPMATTLPLLGERHCRERVFLITEFGGAAPEALYNDLILENSALRTPHSALPFYEGIVAKRDDKPYPIQLLSPNKETPWMMKHRFDQ